MRLEVHLAVVDQVGDGQAQRLASMLLLDRNPDLVEEVVERDALHGGPIDNI